MHDTLDDSLLFAAAGDPAGRQWIADLPQLLDTMCLRWGLEAQPGSTHHGYHAIVSPVTRGGQPLVLKLTWPADRLIDESRALAAWQGRGAVQMFDVDTRAGAVLLERLDAGRTLLDLDPMEAAEAAGTLLRRLAIPAPAGFPDLRVLAGQIRGSLQPRQERLGSPVPSRWLQEAVRLADHFEHHADNRLLVHADLHHDNILAGTREPWLAIDPKPVAGEPEHAVPELMWTRVDELDDEPEIRGTLAELVRGGSLDAEKARNWAVVRCVDYLLWGFEHGLTEDPKRCERVLAALS